MLRHGKTTNNPNSPRGTTRTPAKSAKIGRNYAGIFKEFN